MHSLPKPVLIVAAYFLLSLALGGSATAEESTRLQDAASSLGFTGHFERHHGMVVDRVHYGTPAWRLELERGDVVQSINGERIRSPKHFAELLRGSPYRVQLTVVDVRTGRLAGRSVFLRAPFEPEEIEAFANR